MVFPSEGAADPAAPPDGVCAETYNVAARATPPLSAITFLIPINILWLPQAAISASVMAELATSGYGGQGEKEGESVRLSRTHEVTKSIKQKQSPVLWSR